MHPLNDLDSLHSELAGLADQDVAEFAQRFFKTGPGEYGEGDRFLGIRVPVLRALARRTRGIPLHDTLILLRSAWHEERLLALLMLVDRHRRGDEGERNAIHRAYLDVARYVNNWDLVDASAEHLVGPHVSPDDLGLLEGLARSDVVWERRIAMLATFYWIRRGEIGPALHIAERLVDDGHDLIHKAVGWMLREVGKRDRLALEAFLDAHYADMPRTMLRYAIEHFGPPERAHYMASKRAGGS